MAAYCAATVNEDGTIEPEVMVSPMDPEEYAKRRAQINVHPSVVTALTIMGSVLMPTCAICGSDARWHVEQPGSSTFSVCEDCQDKVKTHGASFTRI